MSASSDDVSSHGKSTLSRLLVAKPRRIADETSHHLSEQVLDGQGDKDEISSIPTIRSKHTSLLFDAEKDAAVDHKSTEGSKFLVNIIDTPGHPNFSSEAIASLRLTDGALVTIDCVEGMCTQTETLLRHALSERVKPILVITKVDTLLNFHSDKETLYQCFSRTIDSFNATISLYHDKALGDAQVYPEKGMVTFASGLQGWAFTVRQFAFRYVQKFGVNRASISPT
ncbi:P-loop containing nucleoside triphosphate hydrolase protein [Crepidotus variabilis]|uniref:P-loop containing nucleoside triphosphate hydrolase protein n=1 Tax=Crepidotus variabilis TaxID=179855 RepID=A0A9P6ECC8_9AGAR|nr:P-loop containing nucleoside triphosphate hydrolase protein [Crepidotus variabilis]